MTDNNPTDSTDNLDTSVPMPAADEPTAASSTSVPPMPSTASETAASIPIEAEPLAVEASASPVPTPTESVVPTPIQAEPVVSVPAPIQTETPVSTPPEPVKPAPFASVTVVEPPAVTASVVVEPPPVVEPLATEQDTEDLPPVPDHYFLMHPANETVITGTDRTLPPMGAKIVFLFGIPLLIGSIALAVYTVLRWMAVIPIIQAGNAAPPNTVGNIVGWAVVAILINLFVIGLYVSGLRVVNKRRALEKRGQIVWGAVTSASGKLNRFDDLVVTVEYRFDRPRRWRFAGNRVISGKVNEDRNDLKEKMLPSPGTPIAILYLNRDNYEVL
jgi:hypothetical protein